MTRRSFLGALATVSAGFGILPAATTYVRTWSGVLVPCRPSLGVQVWELIALHHGVAWQRWQFDSYDRALQAGFDLRQRCNEPLIVQVSCHKSIVCDVIL